MKTIKLTPLHKYTRLILVLAAISAMFFLAVTPALAQSPVTAEVDRTTLSTGESLTLTIRMEGANASNPNLPVLDGFQIISTSKSSQISIINGSMSSQAAYHYVLQPTRAGQLTIPAIPVVVAGQTHTTQPFTIEVTQGAAPSQPSQPNQPPDSIIPPSQEFSGQDLFVESIVDHPNPYIGQQVTHTFRFFRAVNLSGQPTYEAPNFNGFWNESETQQTDYDVQIGSRTYRVVELQTILFPTSVGQHTISPASLNISGSLFRSDTRLGTDAITLDVRSLPEPAPEGFHGAVGNFTVATSVDTDRLAVNEPVTLKVVISGEGNISNLPDPEVPVINNWRSYESTSTVDTQTQNGRVSGSRTIEQLMVPGSAGEFSIPGITYTFFNPQTEAYQTVSNNPIAIHVAEGAVDASLPQNSPGSDAPIDWLDNDIRHIKAAPESLEVTQRPLVASPVYWLFWLFPVGALVIDVVWQKRKRYLSQNPEQVRSSKAQKKAHLLLSKARKQKTDPFAAINQALTGYLSDRFNHPVAGMTQSDLVDFLDQNGLPPSLTQQITETLMLGEMGRFAPAAANQGTAGEMFKDTEKLIARIEKVIS
jgi:hypothetical protein